MFIGIARPDLDMGFSAIEHGRRLLPLVAQAGPLRRHLHELSDRREFWSKVPPELIDDSPETRHDIRWISVDVKHVKLIEQIFDHWLENPKA